MAGRRGAEEAESAGGSLRERECGSGGPRGPKACEERRLGEPGDDGGRVGGVNENIWQLRGERGQSLAEKWDLGRVERRKWGRKADRQVGWGSM